MVNPKFSFRMQSPDQKSEFTIQVKSEQSLSKEKVMSLIKENKNIKLDILDKKESFNCFVGKKIVSISIIPLTSKDYLKSVDQLISVQQNWFKELISAFSRLVKWVFYIKEKAKINKTELAFAMHLFRNADTDLFKALTNSSSDVLAEFQQMGLSMSDVIGIWTHFFDEITPYLAKEEREIFDDFVPSLQDLQKFQKEIEKIRKTSSKGDRVKKREKLEQTMLEKAEAALKKGKPFYMPGGYINPKTGENAQMIYELTKNEEGQVNLRVIDMSKTFSIEQESAAEFEDLFSFKQGGAEQNRIAPSITGTLNEQGDIKNFLNRALRAQVGPPHALYKKKLSKWEAVKLLIFGAQVDEEEHSRKGLVEGLAEELKADEESATIKQKDVIEPSKLMEVFFKTTKPDLYRGKKTLLKVASFLSLYRQLRSRINDPEIRQWMRDNAESLLLSLEKTEEKTSPFGMERLETERAGRDVKYIEGELKKIIDYIDACDQKQTRKVPKSPGKQKGVRSSFGEKMHTPTLSKASGFRTSEAKVDSAEPLREIVLSDHSFDEVYAHYLGSLKSIQTQIDKKNWNNSAVLLEDMSRMLDHLQESNVLNEISNEEAKKWSALVRDFGLMSAQVSYGLGYIVPTPSFIHYNLQSLMIADKLLRAYDETGVYKRILL